VAAACDGPLCRSRSYLRCPTGSGLRILSPDRPDSGDLERITLIPVVTDRSTPELPKYVKDRAIRPPSDILERIISRMNTTLREWFVHRQHKTHGSFRVIDGFVRRRSGRRLQAEKQLGFGRCKADDQRWPNGIFTSHELLSLRPVHAMARRFRGSNLEPESPVRENHTHSWGGGDA
jgi:hypothetical protein